MLSLADLKCECGGQLLPVWFIEEETKVVAGALLHTGRKRRAVDHLYCDSCFNRECVDDSFDGPWYR